MWPLNGFHDPMRFSEDFIGMVSPQSAYRFRVCPFKTGLGVGIRSNPTGNAIHKALQPLDTLDSMALYRRESPTSNSTVFWLAQNFRNAPARSASSDFG